MGEFAERLRKLESDFSGGIIELPRIQSPLDGTKQPPMNRGADKMHPRGMNYAQAYENLLADFTPKRIVELGVFTGVSMALWCEVYPVAEVIGLDVDLNRVDFDRLADRGAFTWNRPQLFQWDAFDPQPLDVLQDVDLFVDDGPHVTEAVVKVAEFIKPRMAPGGRFIVEDMDNGADILRQVFSGCEVRRFGKIAGAFL